RRVPLPRQRVLPGLVGSTGRCCPFAAISAQDHADSYSGRTCLTNHSSRCRFAARLNSGVRQHGRRTMISKDKDPVGWALLMYELEDAQEHLANLIAEMARDPEYGEENLRIDLG